MTGSKIEIMHWPFCKYYKVCESLFVDIKKPHMTVAESFVYLTVVAGALL